MKAKIKGFDDPFKEIETLTMKGVNGTFYVDDVEFEQQQEPISDHWQDVRERAAMLAMQSIIPTQKGKYMLCDVHKKYDDCATEAIEYADALVKKLEGE